MSFKYPRVVVITLNYNKNQYTLSCIESLLKSNYPDFEILLIDNGSEPENVKELEEKLNKKVNLHKISPNRGYVGGINYGLEEGRKLKPDYFLIMNNDTIIDSKAISELIKSCKNCDNKAIVTGKVYDFDTETIQYIGEKLTNYKLLKYEKIGQGEKDRGQYNVEEERDMIDDIFWLFHRDLYFRNGGYSNHFWFNAEQRDFAIRAKNIGYKLIYTPNAVIWHKGSITEGGRTWNPRLAFWTIQSSLILRYKHLSFYYFLIYILISINSIISTYIKMTVNCLLMKEYSYSYANGKLLGFTSFIVWLFKKNKTNKGYNPFKNVLSKS